MMLKHESVWEKQLGKITVVKHGSHPNLPNELSVYTSYLAAHKQRDLKRKEVTGITKADVAEPAIAKWALHIVFVPKTEKSAAFMATISGCVLVKYGRAIRYTKQTLL